MKNRNSFYLLLACLLLFSCGAGVKNGDINVEKASNLLEKGDSLKAKKHLLVAISKDLKRYKRELALTMLGNIYDGMKMRDSAIFYYKRSLEANPKYQVSMVNLGLTYAAMGENDKALELYELAIKTDSTYAEAYSALGALCINTDKFGDAVRYLRKAIEAGSDNVNTHYNLGIALAWNNEFEEARKEVKTLQHLGDADSLKLKNEIAELETTYLENN